MAESTAQRTPYVILRMVADTPEGGTWTPAGRAQASNAETAIREVAGEREGVYRAVPARSWSEPVAVSVETKKVVKLGSPSRVIADPPDVPSGGDDAPPDE